MAIVPLTVGAALRLSAATIFAVNAAGFTVTAITKSHKITDLCGTSAFVASAWATHAASLASSSSPPPPPFPPSASSLARLARILKPTPTTGFALAAVVTVWGARLSSHLFRRVLRLGKDERLDFLFPAEGESPFVGGESLFPLKLAGFWTAQGAWAFACLLPVTAVHGIPSAASKAPLGLAGAAFVSAALAFVAAEAVADKQKDDHHRDASKRGKPCIDGLYSVVRFPNYASEIGFWSSVAAAAAAAPGVLSAAPLAVAASPVFTYLLLSRASGIPPLEEAHERKYGRDPDFQRWKRETPRLFPDVFKLISSSKRNE